MKSSEIRKKFYEFFVNKNHEKVKSSSIIPAQDPTLLFTNAGMNQFKDVFLGNEKRSYTKATTIQKCIRAGGKHNDLDNVGFTKRHLTFFEMMGNFSFGDYFKKEAIKYAWQLLTEEYKLKPEDMYVSVYQDDDESYNIWLNDIGIEKNRIVRLGKKDNFWQMGDTGPCGPCTEIHLDQRPENERSKQPVYDDFEQGRLLEVWNLVFMQYNQQEDGTLKPLAQTGVDTGVGIERLAAVLQNKDTVFQTDLFEPILTKITELTGINYQTADSKTKAAFNVLADHIRSSSLIIADGQTPSNEGRGYVLRKIIRRAALFAQKLTDKNIFPELAKTFIESMHTVYPELKTNKELIVSLLTTEIEQFAQNLIRGQAILQGYFTEQKESKIITGQQAFKLYDTYGFPLEVTIIASQEKGYTVNTKDFAVCMEQQKEKSGKKMKTVQQEIDLPEDAITNFVGYHQTESGSSIVGLIQNKAVIKTAKTGSIVTYIAKECPFFVAMGGQVDDAATVTINGKTTPVLKLEKLNNGQAIGVTIKTPVDLSIGTKIIQNVDIQTRKSTMNNHTATHLLQAALIELLGKQVKQSGSVVNPDYLRFDFTYHKNLTPEQISWVENRVNEKIRENITVDIFQTSYKKAIDKGVIAIFGEKYNPENVRVIDVPGFSAELCGGTHVPSTGVIGVFKITEVSALSAGNRRIFAVTGQKAIELMQQNFNSVKLLSQKFKVKPEQVTAAVEKQTTLISELEKEIRTAKKELIKNNITKWTQEIKTCNNVPILSLLVKNYQADELKNIMNALQQKQPGFYCIATNNGNKSIFLCQIASEYLSVVSIQKIKDYLATHGLRGGGKTDTLQGGGPALLQALDISKVL